MCASSAQRFGLSQLKEHSRQALLPLSSLHKSPTHGIINPQGWVTFNKWFHFSLIWLRLFCPLLVSPSAFFRSWIWQKSVTVASWDWFVYIASCAPWFCGWDFVPLTPSGGASSGDDWELAQIVSCFPECAVDASVDSAPFQLHAAPFTLEPQGNN